MLKKIWYIFVFTILSSVFASADTTDQTWMIKVELTKTGKHCIDDKNCFNRYHPNIPPAAITGISPHFAASSTTGATIISS